MKIYSAESDREFDDGESHPVYFTTLKKAWSWKVKDLRQKFKEEKADAIENKKDYILDYCPKFEIAEETKLLVRIKARKFSMDWTIECEPGNMICEHDLKPGLRSFVLFLNKQIGGAEILDND